MKIKGIEPENFTNYKLPSMFIATCFCDFKCAFDGGFDKSICQNSALMQSPNIEITNEDIYQKYISNPISKAVVIGGMEPMMQIDDIIKLIAYFRSHEEYCDFVIYTGYYKEEIQDKIDMLKQYSNIIVKFGRFLPNQTTHHDEILGVELASDNQYAEVIGS